MQNTENLGESLHVYFQVLPPIILNLVFYERKQPTKKRVITQLTPMNGVTMFFPYEVKMKITKP